MPAYPIWANIAIYQGIWFIGVLGKERFAAVLLVLLVLHFWWVKDRLTESLIVVSCTLIGVCVDSVLTLTGWFVFTPEASVLPIPLWLVGIWIGFAATFRHALAYFFARPVWAIALAAVGAPLTYVAAARLGAVALPYGPVWTALVLLVVWTALMGMFVWITQTIVKFRHA